jgi:internalin A
MRPEGVSKIWRMTVLWAICRMRRIRITFPRLEVVAPALASLTKLTRLVFVDNQIADVSPLASLTKLTTLHLHNNQIADVSMLASMTGLIRLYLRGNQIVDVSPLASLSELACAEIG